MSVTVTAHSIIGVKLPKTPFESVQVRGCQHPTEGDPTYCPQCGEKTWKKQVRPLAGYDEDEGRWGEFDVGISGNPECPTYYVGIEHVQTRDCMYACDCWAVRTPLPKIDTTELEKKLKAFLQPLNLWSSPVGLWTFGYVS